MAGRGPQSFKKRQKEQARKEWQEEKRARKLQRQQGKGQEEDAPPEGGVVDENPAAENPAAEQVQNP